MKFQKGDLVLLKKGNHYFGKTSDLPGSVGIVLRIKRHEPHFVLYEVMVFGKNVNVRAPARCFDHLDDEFFDSPEETDIIALDERLT
jgi:hypothetical protein